MNKNNYPLKQKIKCPMCDYEFIPDSFNVEKLDVDQAPKVGEIYKIKPSAILRRVWVTYCVECNYAIRFAAEILRKELVEKPTNKSNGGEFGEYGKIYKYKIYTYEKPFMELTDYKTGIIDRIITRIKTSLDDLRISEWGSIYNDWKNEKTIDSFKFFTRFISNLDIHYKSMFKNDVGKKCLRKLMN